ncbi:MAG: YraN family protein [Pseudorhizobium sp.]
MAATNPSQQRRRAQRRGPFAEYLAAAFLLAKGYRIIAIRFRTKAGEVDLIARKGDLAVFVEVKARVGEREALDAVSATAQKRIRAASDVWLAKPPDAARLSQR